MAYQMPYGQTQNYQATQYFPQPQGNVYLINNSLEVSNIPMGAGLSVAICFNEGIAYIKTMQGGAPAVTAAVVLNVILTLCAMRPRRILAKLLMQFIAKVKPPAP